MLQFRSQIAAAAAGTLVVFGASATFAQSASMPMGAATSMGASGAMGMSSINATDKTFVKNAAIGGMTEVDLGKIAAAKGGSQAVKAFGTKMVDDHTKADDELKATAMPLGLTPPAALDATHQRVVDKFNKMSGGTAFDRAYRTQMIADHKTTIALFQKEAKSGKNADLKAFAVKTLPTLQEHLKMANTM